MLRKCQYDSHKVNVSTILSKRQKKKRANTPFLLIVIYLGFGHWQWICTNINQVSSSSQAHFPSFYP